MKNILYISSSPRGEESYSSNLANELIKKLRVKHKELNITQVDFAQQPPTHLSARHLRAMFTPAEHQSAEQRLYLSESDEYVTQLKDNEIIIISYPVWNFLVPSCLKSWIDQIVRQGVTFERSGHIPQGLIKGKKVFLVLSRGGVYPDSYDNDPNSLYDFSIHYMKTVLGYIGMKDISVVKAEGVAIPGVQETAMEKAISSIEVI